jgi:flagellar motor component MotA
MSESTRPQRDGVEGSDVALSVAAPSVHPVGDAVGRLVAIARGADTDGLSAEPLVRVDEHALAEGLSRPLVLRVVVLNSLFALALVAARIAYHGHVHPIVYVAVAVVLLVYAAGAVQVIRLAMRPALDTEDERHTWQCGLRRLDRLAARCPKVAMVGTVMGFLIAFSGSTDDVSVRVRGASTGLVATLIGIASMLLLELQHDWLSVQDETH